MLSKIRLATIASLFMAAALSAEEVSITTQWGAIKGTLEIPSGVDRPPVHIRKNCALSVSPRSVAMRQLAAASSQVAEVTRVSKWMSRRRSKRSATWFR